RPSRPLGIKWVAIGEWPESNIQPVNRRAAVSIRYGGVPVGTIKRHVTGKGNAGKPEVIEAVPGRGCAPAADNEADTLALLTYVRDAAWGGGCGALRSGGDAGALGRRSRNRFGEEARSPECSVAGREDARSRWGLLGVGSGCEGRIRKIHLAPHCRSK